MSCEVVNHSELVFNGGSSKCMTKTLKTKQRCRRKPISEWCTPHHEYTLQSIHKLEQHKSDGTFPGTDNQTKTKNKITTVTTQRNTRRPHTDPTSFFFLYFQDQNTYKNEKVQRTEGNKLKKKALWAQRRNCHLVDSRYSVIQWNPYYTVYPWCNHNPTTHTHTVTTHSPLRT